MWLVADVNQWYDVVIEVRIKYHEKNMFIISAWRFQTSQDQNQVLIGLYVFILTCMFISNSKFKLNDQNKGL